MNDYSLFEFENNMLTKDNYKIKINGSLTIKETENEKELISKIEIILKDFISENLLEEVLLIVEKKDYINDLPELDKLSASFDNFEISTIDAKEENNETIEYDINPELETQKQNKGIFGWFKKLFNN
tara:strand:+ start:177 stop:557 length:381 start_codon:yes stop_codon:yes gene_type:complete